MTLVEIMVATGLMTLVGTAVLSFTFFTSHSFAALVNYVDLDVHSRNALDVMSTDIRQALDLNAASATNLVFDTFDLNTGATNTLRYGYDPVGQTLTRTYNGQSSTLLTECASLQFGIYQRNTTPTNSTSGDFGNDSNIYVPVATADPSQCKVVELTWISSRKILGKLVNTESVQSAQFVIRKK